MTPLQFALRLSWNVCELLHIRMPGAPWAFGVIVGSVRREKIDMRPAINAAALEMLKAMPPETAVDVIERRTKR